MIYENNITTSEIVSSWNRVTFGPFSKFNSFRRRYSTVQRHNTHNMNSTRVLTAGQTERDRRLDCDILSNGRFPRDFTPPPSTHFFQRLFYPDDFFSASRQTFVYRKRITRIHTRLTSVSVSVCCTLLLRRRISAVCFRSNATIDVYASKRNRRG